MQHLSDKTQFPGFLFPPGSAEALVRCGEKIKYILIAYFLGNIFAKNCRNRTVYVKIIASCKGGRFLRHGVEVNTVQYLEVFTLSLVVSRSYNLSLETQSLQCQSRLGR